jgi:hypothetical protein
VKKRLAFEGTRRKLIPGEGGRPTDVLFCLTPPTSIAFA